MNPIVRGLAALASLLIAATTAAGPAGAQAFRLQLLHASDLEGGVEALERAANFAAIVDALEDLEANTLILSAGDNYIPGPFFNAAGDQAKFRDSGLFNAVYNDLFGLTSGAGYAGLREGEGRVDISIMNIVGFDASALGNHEFDAGTSQIGAVIAPDFRAAGLADDRWVGAQFPYLSANLDVSGDASLGRLFTPDILPSTAFATGPEQSLAGTAAPKIAPATTAAVGAETIGIIGATTQLLASISSVGGVAVVTGGADDMVALAGILQPLVDKLRVAGVNKIVLVSHLQQIALETELGRLLDGVDIIVAGGSNTILADADDRLEPGDSAAGAYPRLVESPSREPVAIVSTDGEYSYLGRLVVEFDERGRIVPAAIDPALNGPIASTRPNVEALWGSLATAFAQGAKGELVRRLTEAAAAVVRGQDGTILGRTGVFLEGRREPVRTEETNLGDLSADANLWYANELMGAALDRDGDGTVGVEERILVSLKNGGGIRFPIGEVMARGGAAELLPPQANPMSGKKAGEISQLDVVNSLRFNNTLAVVELTSEEILTVLEHGVAAVGPGSTPGQFPQLAGIRFSYDPGHPAGDRVRSAAIVDSAGKLVAGLAREGEILRAAAGRSWQVVTLGFLADGGDSYPFPGLIDRRTDLGAEQAANDPGDFGFAATGTEQDAIAEYLAAFHNAASANPYEAAETPLTGDERIQNVGARRDTVADLLP